MIRVRRRPSPAMVVASLALLLALGGTSIAAVSALPRNSVGTAQLRNNAVTSSKVKNGTLKAVDFAAGQLPAGEQGPAGPAGAAATALWASIDPTGTLVRSKGAASALKIGVGQYQVIFNQDVTGCIYLATLGGPTTGIAPGEISVAQRTAIPAGVQVVTFSSAGAISDRPFYVAVFC